MVQKLFLFILILVSILLLSACAGLAADLNRSESAANRDTLYQVSTISSLIAGQYDGDQTVADLQQHGDFGLGTFNALDGEMIVSDGVVYQVKADGIAYQAQNDTLTPFAAITPFSADQEFELKETLSCEELQKHLAEQFLLANKPYALKIEGSFASMETRAPRKQDKPYPPLSDALAEQVVFDFQDVRGAMIGFRLPEYMQEINSTGYHFHFLTEAKDAGGHVLDCQVEEVTIAVDDIDAYFIAIP
ncbi:MAG: acetolactate decarboxylase [Candidatus Promineifilaceae bacterium]|nr:acetolactate decarboxylase [Candidatus Promineifilaceae bacterium]